jgi:hypothetical protein
MINVKISPIMSAIGYTAIKSTDHDQILDLTNRYFSKVNLRLVEEKIGTRVSKYTTVSKCYPNLKEYDLSEIRPLTQHQAQFTTNFDFFINLEKSSGWSAFYFPTRLAQYTLNIDKELTSFLSERLDTIAFDYFEYTVVDQKLIRSYQNGELKDLYFSPGDGDIEEATGYFEALQDYKYEDLDEDDIDKKEDIISNFNKEIGFLTYYPNALDANSRHPMYLKGRPEDIFSFLSRKKDDFYFLY